MNYNRKQQQQLGSPTTSWYSTHCDTCHNSIHCDASQYHNWIANETVPIVWLRLNFRFQFLSRLFKCTEKAMFMIVHKLLHYRTGKKKGKHLCILLIWSNFITFFIKCHYLSANYVRLKNGSLLYASQGIIDIFSRDPLFNILLVLTRHSYIILRGKSKKNNKRLI